MALSVKHDGAKQVPWFSLAEWHEVYKQIYSNNTIEQTKAYEVLLVWKTRMSKLPVGVECTLSILQVCLRDRDWMSKIDNREMPMYFEKDLCLMYSTTIMRVLNHISNIGHTKQTSLFQIAKQLKIPEWIVNLRHNAAHGHEFPSIGELRIATNILLTWLHEEYWAPEACAMEEYYIKETDILDEIEGEFEEKQAFIDLIELWTAVSLYIHVGHSLVSDIPDIRLRETLQDLRTYVLSQHNNKTSDNDEQEYVQIKEKYNLTAAQTLLLSEISVYLTENKSMLKDTTVCNILCESEAFLPNSDIMQIFTQEEKDNTDLKRKILPTKMLWFWKDIIILFQNKDLLEKLVFRLFSIVDEEKENKERRSLAALWISSIVYSFMQLNIAQSISHDMENKLKKINKKLSTKVLNQHIKEYVQSNHPYLENVLWFDSSTIIPNFIIDKHFLSKLILRVNEFSVLIIEPILKLFTTKIDVQMKEKLINLVDIYTYKRRNINKDIHQGIFTVEKLHANAIKDKTKIHRKNTIKKKTIHLLKDQIYNSHWKPLDTSQQIGCSIGLLSWQIDSVKSLKPLKPNQPKHPVSVLDSQIVAGIIDSKHLKMQSRINWNNVLRKRKKMKREYDKDIAITIMNRALEIAKKQK